MLNHKLIADTLMNAYTMLDNEDFSSLTNVRSAMNDLESIEDYDPAYKGAFRQLVRDLLCLRRCQQAPRGYF